MFGAIETSEKTEIGLIKEQIAEEIVRAQINSTNESISKEDIEEIISKYGEFEYLANENIQLRTYKTIGDVTYRKEYGILIEKMWIDSYIANIPVADDSKTGGCDCDFAPLWTAIGDINNKITTIDNRLNSFDTAITNINNRFSSYDSQITTINNKISTIETQISSINTTINSIQTNINTLQGSIASKGDTKVMYNVSMPSNAWAGANVADGGSLLGSLNDCKNFNVLCITFTATTSSPKSMTFYANGVSIGTWNTSTSGTSSAYFTLTTWSGNLTAIGSGSNAHVTKIECFKTT